MAFDASKYSLTTRRNFAVLVPELALAAPAAIGAILFATKVTPHQFEAAKNFVSKHIVQPRLQFFDSLGGSVRRAHEKHKQEKQDEAVKLGLPVKPIVDEAMSPKERADTVAELLLKGAAGLTGDIAVTFVGQHALNKILKAEINANKTSFSEFAMHLGGVLMMPTLLAGMAENIHHGLAKTLHRSLGISKDRADDIGNTLAYLTLPGTAASLLSLKLAHSNGKSIG